MTRLKCKTAFITGGAKGIGKSIAELFANEGAKVIITDILDDEGKKLADKIGNQAIFYHLDVSDEQEWQKVTNQIQRDYGYIDIMVNNAGITGLETGAKQDPENVTLKDWQYVHKVNLDGVFLGCKFAISMMKKRGGSIINMSSRSGIVGVPTTSAYASTKAAIRNHTKTVALYCASKKYNIRCNSLHPGAIITDIWNPMLGEDKDLGQKNLSKSIPIGKMGQPIDVAYAALYLASSESKYMTGAEMILDGGILAGSSAAPIKD
ncbi:glucose 1-dehydrogenase [Rickettsiales bacterium]|nr:glucose 1-dehydrogenase [Rickettsiales bacterium]